MLSDHLLRSDFCTLELTSSISVLLLVSVYLQHSCSTVTPAETWNEAYASEGFHDQPAQSCSAEMKRSLASRAIISHPVLGMLARIASADACLAAILSRDQPSL